MPPFLSTLSLRRATFSLALYSPLPANFYPRSPCGERLMELHFSDECGGISIHALLAESDLGPLLRCGRYWHISIHALLAESDTGTAGSLAEVAKFLSTLSLRRATVHITEHASPCRISIHALLAESDTTRHISPLTQSHFYPRSPCGERRSRVLQRDQQPHISIHALLAESDVGQGQPVAGKQYFYPRSPCGERRNTG